MPNLASQSRGLSPRRIRRRDRQSAVSYSVPSLLLGQDEPHRIRTAAKLGARALSGLSNRVDGLPCGFGRYLALELRGRRATVRWGGSITTTTHSTTCACFTATVTTSLMAKGACDKGLYPGEPREGKLSRVVREWRRGGRPPRRP